MAVYSIQLYFQHSYKNWVVNGIGDEHKHTRFVVTIGTQRVTHTSRLPSAPQSFTHMPARKCTPMPLAPTPVCTHTH